jgi:hypothetical protein
MQFSSARVRWNDGAVLFSGYGFFAAGFVISRHFVLNNQLDGNSMAWVMRASLMIYGKRAAGCLGA